jgi:hypothetical protein
MKRRSATGRAAVLTALLLTAAVLTSCGKDQLRALQQIAAETPLFPGFQQLSSSDKIDLDRATLMLCYNSATSMDRMEDVKSFYTRVFTERGWTVIPEQELRRNFLPSIHYRDDFAFRKGEYSVGIKRSDAGGGCHWFITYVWEKAWHASSRRNISFAVISMACVVLAPVIARRGSSFELLGAKPSVELRASKTVLTIPCPPGMCSTSGACPSTADLQVSLTAITRDFKKQFVYVYTVTGGRVVGEGSKVTWNLSDVSPGFYFVTVEVKDDKQHRAAATVNVTVQACGDCLTDCFGWCPAIFVSCYDAVKVRTPITCKVVLQPSGRPVPLTFEWSVRDWNGEDLSEKISGQGKSISIRTDGLGGRHLTTTVKVKGVDPSCNDTASGSTLVKP